MPADIEKKTNKRNMPGKLIWSFSIFPISHTLAIALNFTKPKMLQTSIIGPNTKHIELIVLVAIFSIMLSDKPRARTAVSTTHAPAQNIAPH